MKCQVNQVISHRIQLTEVIVNSITYHDKGTVMVGHPGKCAERTGLSKKEGYVFYIPDIEIFLNVMQVVIMKVVMKGVEIYPKR